MTNPADHEALQAAQILCMLAQGTRQQNVDPDETEDEQDCVITHVRPVVHRHRPVVQRHHPYRRPEPQRVGVPAARSRGMSPNVEAERMAREREYLHRDNWNVFPLEEHEAQPGAPVPEVRRVVRYGVVVPEKVPLPLMQPLGVPRPIPVQRPTLVEQPTPQATPDRHSIPDCRPSSSQPPSPNEEDVSSTTQYSTRSLAFQALLAAPEGQWMSMNEIADSIEKKYPHLREAEATERQRIRTRLSSILPQSIDKLEKSVSDDIMTPVQWRLPASARNTAAMMAWRPKMQSSTQGQVVPTAPYASKSLMLQALLAAPEGRWISMNQLIDYLFTKYPQLPGVGRGTFWQRMHRALSQSLDLVERTVRPQRKARDLVYWRLSRGVREEATRLAWPDRFE